MRGRQPRGKLSPELNFSAPPDYATVIIETERHTQQNLSDYSISASQDLATTSSLVSSELPLVESLQRSCAEIVEQQPVASALEPERDSIHSQSFRYTNLKESSEALSLIRVSNAEPIDSIVDGASALATPSEDNIYSVPTPATETDNALTEYTLVKEVKVEWPKKDEGKVELPKNDHPDLEIYSSASTLSLGETVILSDGWLNRAPTPRNNQNSEESSDFILTLDVDTSASVI